MTVLKIYVAPHPVLKKKAEPLKTVTDADRKFMDDIPDLGRDLSKVTNGRAEEIVKRSPLSTVTRGASLHPCPIRASCPT